MDCEIKGKTNSFLSFWAIVCPLILLTTQKNKIKKNNKKTKKRLEILSFYTCVPQLMVICMVPDIWRVTDRIYSHFGPFFALYPPNNAGNQNFEKNEKKNRWRYHHLKQVRHK